MMVIATRREMNRLLTALAVILLGLAVLVDPAGAHDWLWRRPGLAYPYAERDPSNPRGHPSTVRYRSVMGGLESYRPVEPLPWGDVNRRVAPAPEPPPKPEQEK